MDSVFATKKCIVMVCEERLSDERAAAMVERLEMATGMRCALIGGARYIKPDEYLPELKDFLDKVDAE